MVLVVAVEKCLGPRLSPLVAAAYLDAHLAQAYEQRALLLSRGSHAGPQEAQALAQPASQLGRALGVGQLGFRGCVLPDQVGRALRLPPQRGADVCLLGVEFLVPPAGEDEVPAAAAAGVREGCRWCCWCCWCCCPAGAIAMGLTVTLTVLSRGRGCHVWKVSGR